MNRPVSNTDCVHFPTKGEDLCGTNHEPCPVVCHDYCSRETAQRRLTVSPSQRMKVVREDGVQKNAHA